MNSIAWEQGCADTRGRHVRCAASCPSVSSCRQCPAYVRLLRRGQNWAGAVCRWCCERGIVQRMREPLAAFLNYGIFAITGMRCRPAGFCTLPLHADCRAAHLLRLKRGHSMLQERLSPCKLLMPSSLGT